MTDTPKPPPGPSVAGWHQISSIFDCHKKYQLDQVRRIRPAGQVQTPDALAIGLMIHAGRAEYFAGKCHDDCIAAMAIEASRQPLPCGEDAMQRAYALFDAYVEHWQNRPPVKTLAAEYEIGPAPLVPGDPFFKYRTARLDDVSEYPEAGSGLWIGEAKTTSAGIGEVTSEYTIHGQTLMQAALWKTAPQGEAKHGPIQGIMLDVMVKGYGSRRPTFGRVPIHITDRMIEWFRNTLRSRLQTAAAIDWNSVTERNPAGCTKMIGRARVPCPYRELCIHGEKAAFAYEFEDGRGLHEWKPSDGKVAAPWD